jgi:hypothetical protein
MNTQERKHLDQAMSKEMPPEYNEAIAIIAKSLQVSIDDTIIAQLKEIASRENCPIMIAVKDDDYNRTNVLIVGGASYTPIVTLMDSYKEHHGTISETIPIDLKDRFEELFKTLPDPISDEYNSPQKSYHQFISNRINNRKKRR